MTQAAALLRQAFAPVLPAFTGSVFYVRGTTSKTVLAAVRDLRADDLFGAAALGDRLVRIEAGAFNALGLGEPQRYDRIVMVDGSYSVIDWLMLPPDVSPVWFKFAVRGGTK